MKNPIISAITLLAIASLACGSLDTAVTQATATLTAQSNQSGGTVSPAQSTGITQPEGTGADVVLPTDTPASTESPTDTASPAASTADTSRDNPAPFGATVDIGGALTLTVTKVIRPADDVVAKANQFNKKPPSGQEYLQVTATFVCTKPSSEKCAYDGVTELKAVGTDGNVVQPELISGVDNVLSAGELFGGAKKTGSAFYLVTQGDDAVIIFYDPFLGTPTYMALK